MKRKACEACYADESRITPLRNPLNCLENHTQYICGTCRRCICIEHAPDRRLQRWNFPFKPLNIAKPHLRTADYTTKTASGIYESGDTKGRLSYKIFAENDGAAACRKSDCDHFFEKCKEWFRLRPKSTARAAKPRESFSCETISDAPLVSEFAEKQ